MAKYLIHLVFIGSLFVAVSSCARLLTGYHKQCDVYSEDNSAIGSLNVPSGVDILFSERHEHTDLMLQNEDGASANNLLQPVQFLFRHRNSIKMRVHCNPFSSPDNLLHSIVDSVRLNKEQFHYTSANSARPLEAVYDMYKKEGVNIIVLLNSDFNRFKKSIEGSIKSLLSKNVVQPAELRIVLINKLVCDYEQRKMKTQKAN